MKIIQKLVWFIHKHIRTLSGDTLAKYDIFTDL